MVVSDAVHVIHLSTLLVYSPLKVWVLNKQQADQLRRDVNNYRYRRQDSVFGEAAQGEMRLSRLKWAVYPPCGGL